MRARKHKFLGRIKVTFPLSALGFCDYEEAETAHGCYNWTEVEAGSINTLPCFYVEPADQFIPGGMARRECSGPRMWIEYNGEECITRITHEFWLLANVSAAVLSWCNTTDSICNL